MKHTLFLVLLCTAFFNTVFCEDQKFSTDAVVQVTAHYSLMDPTEPYKIKEQGSRSGSGFFFDEHGHILTNYHVIQDAKVVFIQMPRFGAKEFTVTVKSIYPDRDVALLEMSPEDIESVNDEIGFFPHLFLGNSNELMLGNEVTLYGYPLGRSDLKSMKSDIRGFEHGNLVTGANSPGNSGGPLVDQNGKVIGIHTSYDDKAKMAYAIPINNVLCVLPDMFSHRILYDPALGMETLKGDANLTEYYCNPRVSGGRYVAALCEGSLLSEVGVQNGDMIYKVDSYIVNELGRIRVPWRQNAITAIEYVSGVKQGQSVHITVYRQGEELSFDVFIDRTKKPEGIQKTYQEFETIDYEIFGGFVVMELSINIVDHFSKNNFSGIEKYRRPKYKGKTVLIVTELLPSSPARQSGHIDYAAIVESVNGTQVTTLEEYRDTIKNAVTNDEYVVFGSKRTREPSDIRSTFVIPVDTIADNEPRFAKENFYTITPFTQSILSTLKQKDETKKTA